MGNFKQAALAALVAAAGSSFANPLPNPQDAGQVSSNTTVPSNGTSEAGTKPATTKNTGEVVKLGQDMLRGVNLGGWLVLEP